MILLIHRRDPGNACSIHEETREHQEATYTVTLFKRRAVFRRIILQMNLLGNDFEMTGISEQIAILPGKATAVTEKYPLGLNVWKSHGFFCSTATS